MRSLDDLGPQAFPVDPVGRKVAYGSQACFSSDRRILNCEECAFQQAAWADTPVRGESGDSSSLAIRGRESKLAGNSADPAAVRLPLF